MNKQDAMCTDTNCSKVTIKWQIKIADIKWLQIVQSLYNLQLPHLINNWCTQPQRVYSVWPLRGNRQPWCSLYAAYQVYALLAYTALGSHYNCWVWNMYLVMCAFKEEEEKWLYRWKSALRKEDHAFSSLRFVFGHLKRYHHFTVNVRLGIVSYI